LSKWCPLSHSFGPHVCFGCHVPRVVSGDDVTQTQSALIIFGKINREFQRGAPRHCCGGSRGCGRAICSTKRDAWRLDPTIDNDIGSAFATTNLGEPILNLLVSD
jgi:hypothetical protein